MRCAGPCDHEVSFWEVEQGRIVEVNCILKGEKRSDAGVGKNSLIDGLQDGELGEER